jgi:hypothetical protein
LPTAASSPRISPISKNTYSPHLSPPRYCGPRYAALCGVFSRRAARRTIKYASAPSGRKHHISRHLTGLATRGGKKYGLRPQGLICSTEHDRVSGVPSTHRPSRHAKAARAATVLFQQSLEAPASHDQFSFPDLSGSPDPVFLCPGCAGTQKDLGLEAWGLNPCPCPNREHRRNDRIRAGYIPPLQQPFPLGLGRGGIYAALVQSRGTP